VPLPRWTTTALLAAVLVAGAAVPAVAASGQPTAPPPSPWPTVAGSLGALGTRTASATPAATSSAPGYLPVTATVVADSITGAGLGAVVPVAPGQTVHFPVAGVGGVPAGGVGAVDLTVTAMWPQRPGYLTVYPYGGGVPATSNVNFGVGDVIANTAVVPVGSAGAVAVTNHSSGALQLMVVLHGWYPLGGYQPLPVATRLLDTRKGIGTRLGVPRTGIGFSVGVTGVDGVPSRGVGAVLLNVITVSPSVAGSLFVYPTGAARPAAATLPLQPGTVRASLVVATVGANGQVTVYPDSGAGGPVGTVALVADVEGWTPAGAVYGSLTPTTAVSLSGQPSGTSLTLALAGHYGIPPSGATAAVITVTASAPTTSWAVVYAAGRPRPAYADLLLAARQTDTTVVLAPLGAGGASTITLGAAGTTLTVTVDGYLLAPTYALARVIDVSAWQGSGINWGEVGASGVAGAIAKATEGSSYVDADFAANWRGIKAAGMVRGAYSFGHPADNPVTDATFFVRTVQAAGAIGPGDVLALDIEVTDGQSAAHINAWAATFMSVVAQLTRLPRSRLPVYTDPSFGTTAAAGLSLVRSAGDPLWVANYGVPFPTLPAGWASWTMWQWSDAYRVDPQLTTDASVFNGSVLGLRNWAGL